MSSRWLPIACLVALSTQLGCSSDDELVLVTFNAGLSDLFVAQTTERAPLVADALGALDADVLCLQEVWTQEHADAIRRATPHLPHVIALEPKQELVPGSCDAEALEPLAACVAAACTDPPEVDCILSNCAAEFDAQEGDCGVCLASNLGGTLDEIQTACTSEAGRYAYDGHYGVMLLSREPFSTTDHLELDAPLSRRAVLHGRLESGVDLFCTHLTALEDIPYPAEDGSWEEDQRAQVDALSALVKERATGDRAFILGDLNIGPDEAPERFAELVGLGFTGPLDDSCTFCSDNPLVDDDRSLTIDHILGRDADVTRSRILDDILTIDGGPSALSDHYGVRASVQLGD